MTGYSPVDCAAHSRYELWCMHHRWLYLEWTREGNMAAAGERRPVDLFTRDGGEFLVVEDGDGQREEIRLDRIATARETRIP